MSPLLTLSDFSNEIYQEINSDNLVIEYLTEEHSVLSSYKE